MPHAGWVFSGQLAYNTILALSRAAQAPQTVVLFGGHLGPRSQGSVMARGQIWTPMGTIETDHELAGAMAARCSVPALGPEDCPPDNTVELQFPMLRHLLPDARIVVVQAPASDTALALGEAAAVEARRLKRRVVALGSTDLTHYGPNYSWSPRGQGPEAERWVREENDRRLVDLALALEDQGVIDEALACQNACCPGAAAAAIRCGKTLGATEGHLLSYATSSDVRPSDSLVGYASVVF